MNLGKIKLRVRWIIEAQKDNILKGLDKSKNTGIIETDMKKKGYIENVIEIDVVSISKASKILGISRQALYFLIKKGNLEHFKVGERVFLSKDTLKGIQERLKLKRRIKDDTAIKKTRFTRPGGLGSKVISR